MPKQNSSLNPDLLEGRRLDAWKLKQQGWKQRDIADELGVSPGAVSQWMKRAKDKGIEALYHRPPPGPQPRMTEAEWARIPGLLAQGAKRFGFPTNAWTIDQVVDLIQREFSVTYHPAHMSRLLRNHRINLKTPRWQSRKGWVRQTPTSLPSRRRHPLFLRSKRKRVVSTLVAEANSIDE